MDARTQTSTDGSGEQEAAESVSLDGRLATVVVDLLSMMAEAPSTPGGLREEVEERAEELGFAIPALPHQWQPGQRRAPEPTEVDTVTATGIAGMLELLAELPSTPPHVADEARQHAETIWGLINADPSTGGS